MAKDTMTFKLFGKDVSLSRTFKGAGKEADKLGKGAGKSLSGLGGALAGLGLAGAGAAVGAFAAKSVGAFQSAGGEALKLQRYMGGTIEDASRMSHVAAMSGVDVDTMGRSMGQLSKHMEGNSKVMQSLGVEYRDAQGNLLPMGEVLPDIAAKFAAMENGPEKTALALRLFGKAGMNMVPMLNRGAEGVADLMKQSDALGTTLNDKDAKAVKDATANKRLMGQAIKGLQISIGKNLLPVVTSLVTWFTTKVIPAVMAVVGWLQENKGIVMAVAAVIVPLVAGLGAFVKIMQIIAAVTKAWAIAQLLLNTAFLANPITWVVIAVVALVAAVVIAYKRSETFRRIVDGALRAVGKGFAWLRDMAVKALEWIKTKGWDMFVRLVRNSPIGLYVRGVFAAFRWVRERIGGWITWIRERIGGIVDFFQGIPGRVSAFGQTMVDAITWPWRTALRFIVDMWNRLDFGIPGFSTPFGSFGGIPDLVPDISVPGLASGGIVKARPGGILAQIGEGRYDEAVVPLKRGMGLGGGPTVVIQGGTFIGTNMQRAARELNAAMESERRRGGLVLAGAPR